MNSKVRAFKVMCEKLQVESFVFCISASKAKYTTFKSAKESGYKVKIFDFKARRASDYDHLFKPSFLNRCLAKEFILS